MKSGFDSHAGYSKITSRDGQYIATYSGSEIGMDAPTIGNVEVRDKVGTPIYSSNSTPEIQFSGDSKYFIHRRKLGDSKLVKIELPSGREV
jgi:hypothetical protein